MKIIKYVKSGKNKYKVYLDNGKNLLLYEDVILKFDLLLTHEIKDLSTIIDYNNKYMLYDKVLAFINKKLRCEKEIIKYLEKYQVNEELIKEILGKLKDDNLLNDNLYIKSYIHDKVYLSLDGPYKIKNDLIKLGFKIEDITNELDIFTKELIKERINKYINKQLKSNKKSLYVFKNKVLVNLINLGYKKEDILKSLDNIEINEDNLKEKEEEKLRAKYSRKYNGYELEMIIKKKLYEKGYRN